MGKENKMVKLGNWIDTLKGYAFKSKWYSDEGIALVKTSDFTEDSISNKKIVYIPEEIAKDFEKYKLKHKDVIIQTVGSWPRNPRSVVGKVVKVPLKLTGALLNQNAVKIILHKKLDQDFLFYLLRDNSFKNYIINTAQGAANQASITLDSIKRFSFELKTVPQQQKIATILSNYDDLIENNTKRIQLLEKIANLIYDEWFVKFKFPGHEKVKFVDSELGKIPEGWEVKTFGDVLILEYGKGLPGRIRIPGNYPVYGSSGIVGTHNEYKAEAPGIVVGRAGNAGDIHWAFQNFFPVDSCFFVNITDKDIPLTFFYYSLKEADLKSLISSAAVPGINRNAVYLLPFLNPDKEILKDFDNFISKIFYYIFNLKQKNQNLSKPRDLLLPKLISGQIDVSDLDIKVPKVMEAEEEND